MKRLELLFLVLMANFAFAQQDCADGMFTHPESGKCVTVNQFSEEVENKATEDAKNIVESEGLKSDPNLLNHLAEDVVPMIGAIGVGTASSTVATSCKRSLSAYPMMAAGVAVVGSELNSLIKYKSDSKTLKDRMNSIISEYKQIDSPTVDQKKAFTNRVQVEAFELMARAEDFIADAAGRKKVGHTMAATLYGTAATLAIIEQVQLAVPFTAAAAATNYICAPAVNLNTAIIQTAFTGLGAVTTGATGRKNGNDSAVGAAISSSAVFVGSQTLSNTTIPALTTPIGRAAVSIAGVGFSIAMKAIAKKQEEKARERASTIRQMKMAFVFNDKFGDCNAESRVDPARPDCYCYTEDWKKNPARQESQVCNQHWGKTYTPNTSESDDFLIANGNNNSCITKDYKDDPKCNCLNSNSCLSLPTTFNLNGFPGITTAATSATTTANKYFKGQLSAGELAKLDVGNSAFNKDNILKNLAQNPKTRKIANELKLKSDQFDKKMQSEIAKQAAGGSLSDASSGLKSPFADKIKDQLNETGIVDNSQNEKINKVSLSNSNSSIAMPSPPTFDVDLDFSSLKPGAGIELKEDEQDQSTSQKFGSQASPVAKDDGQTIFQVITDRYQKTGMRKLFANRKRIKTE